MTVSCLTKLDLQFQGRKGWTMHIYAFIYRDVIGAASFTNNVGNRAEKVVQKTELSIEKNRKENEGVFELWP